MNVLVLMRSCGRFRNLGVLLLHLLPYSSEPSNWYRSLEEATGLAFRFIIGKTKDKSKMAALQREVDEYDDFMLLDIEEEYSNLPHKTYEMHHTLSHARVFVLFLLLVCPNRHLILCCRLVFFKAAFALYDSDFYVKADDDIYLRPGDVSLDLIICFS